MESQSPTRIEVSEPESDAHLRIESECSQDCPLRLYDTNSAPVALSTSHHIIDENIKVATPSEIYKEVGELQTRILRLKRGKLYSELVGYLIYVSLDRNFCAFDGSGRQIEYLALSYAWGSRERSHYMRLNGRPFPITQNLWVALQRLRSESDDRQLWIDALCIDQSDNAEMSHQVTSMTPIYHSAIQTIAWLGDTGFHTDLAIRCLRKLKIPTNAQNFENCHSTQCKDALPAVTQGLQDIYNRAWLKRVWIRREIWASLKIVVACGESRISWSGFISSYTICARTLPILADSLNLESLAKLGGRGTDAGNMRTLVRTLTKAWNNDGYVEERWPPLHSQLTLTNDWLKVPDIFRVLNDAVGCESSDDRDRVYALVDLVDDWFETTAGNAAHRRLEVDYSKSTAAVFADVARCVIRFRGKLDLLSMRGLFGARSDLKLPSWVPDWRHPTRPWGVRTYGVRDGWDDASCDSDLGDDCQTLVCQGHRFGTCNTFEHEWIPEKYADLGIDGSNSKLVEVGFLVEKTDLDSRARIWMQEQAKRRLNTRDAEADQASISSFTGLRRAERWLVPKEAKKGDVLVALRGSDLPFVIRSIPVSQGFALVGPAIAVEEAEKFLQHRSARNTFDFIRITVQGAVLNLLGDRDHEEFEHFALV